MPQSTIKPFVVRDVPPDTKRKVKAYAAFTGVTMAEALTDMVAYAYAAYEAEKASKEAEAKE